MSLYAYIQTTRLWWNGRRGQAQCDGVMRELVEPPRIDGVDMVHIDFAPESSCYLIRHNDYDREEEMRPPEIEAVRRWLHCFAESVKRELGMR